MEAEPDYFEMTAGSTNTFTSTITVTSIDGFAEIIALTLPDPSPLSALLSAPSVDLRFVTSASVTLTISAGSTVPAAAYTVIVEGSGGSPAIFNSASLSVEVLGPDFNIEANPSSLILGPVDSKTSTITVTSENGFVGTVSLSLDVEPPDLGASLSAPSVTLGSGGSETVVLTVTSASATPAGDYDVVITGTTGTLEDPLEDSETVNVKVTPDFFMLSDTFLLEILPGETKGSKITVFSLFGFSGDVDLEVVPFPPPPPEFEIVLDPLSVTLTADGSAESTLMVTVDASFEVQALVPIHIVGTGGEPPIERSAAVLVLVPEIDISASPDSLAIDPGSTGSSTISVKSLLHFDGTVTLTATPSDACLEVAFLSPGSTVDLSPGEEESRTLSIIVDDVTPPGIYTVVVDGIVEAEPPYPVFDFALVVVNVGGVDTTPPTWPLEASLTPTLVSQTSVTLSWTDADDNVGVTRYEIWQDGLPVETVVGATTVTVTGLSPDTTYEFQVVAYDAEENFSFGPTLTVTTASTTNNPPTASFTFTPSPATVGEPVSFDGSGSTDTDGTIVDHSWTFGDSGTATDSSASHTYNSAGTFTVTLTVTDDDGATDTETQSITVSEPSVNNPPSLTVPASPVTGDELSEISFTVSASDPDDGQTVTVVCDDCASRGAVFTSNPGSPASGTFRWSPTEPQGADNDYVFTFLATDNGSPVRSDTETVTVHVSEVNLPPVLASIGDKTVQETTSLSFTATASDSDLPTQTLTFSLGPVDTGDFPVGATITESGAFSWTPTAAQGPGSYRARITVTDGSLNDFEDITITVSETPVNNPPVLASIGNKPVNEEALLSFTATATDPDGDELTFSLNPGAPSGASITAGGVFSWTPTEAQGPGSYTVTITVSDGSLTDSETITITVNEVNQPPVLSAPGSRTVTQGSQLTFTVTATDLDSPQTLTYSLEPGAPAGASISSTGVFSWTPSADQATGPYTITVRVSDGTASDTETFTVTVNAPPQAPPAPRPFWEEYWYVLVIIALFLVGIPVVIKARGKPRPTSRA